MDDYLYELRREHLDDPNIQFQCAILYQLERITEKLNETNAVLTKLAENVTSCTYVYRGEPVVRTDPIR